MAIKQAKKRTTWVVLVILVCLVGKGLDALTEEVLKKDGEAKYKTRVKVISVSQFILFFFSENVNDIALIYQVL